MSKERERFDKVWALAVNPGAKEGEALAAFGKIRELVRQNPTLAHSPEPAPPPPPQPTPTQATYKARITNIHPDWQLILVGLLSSTAYDLKLICKISFDFSGTSVAIEILCEGEASACGRFENHVDWCIDYINKELKK